MLNSLSLQKIAALLDRLVSDWQNPPSLDTLAAEAELSLVHFQRIFIQATGISLSHFAQHIGFPQAKQLLKESRLLMETRLFRGNIHDLSLTYEVMTADTYKDMGRNLVIYWGFHDTGLGRILTAQTNRGVCWLAFVKNNDEEEVQELFHLWRFSTFVESPQKTAIVAQAMALGPHNLHLVLRGTGFQIKVWEALLRIPSGSVLSYGDIAKIIGHDKAVRAVGTAVGDNPVGFFVPCHRIIQGSGKIDNYRGGNLRKRVLLAWEAARKGPACPEGTETSGQFQDGNRKLLRS